MYGMEKFSTGWDLGKAVMTGVNLIAQRFSAH